MSQRVRGLSRLAAWDSELAWELPPLINSWNLRGGYTRITEKKMETSIL